MTARRDCSHRALCIPAFLAALVASLLLVGACGSGGAASPGASSLFGQGTPPPTAAATQAAATQAEATEEPSDEPTVEPTEAPTAAVSAPPTPVGSATGGGAIGACGLEAPGEAGTRLKDLDSYRTAIRLAGLTTGATGDDPEGEVTIEATVVRVPEPAVKMTIAGFGGGETAAAGLTYILVGDRAWMDVGGRPIEMPADAAEGLLDTIDSLSPETLYANSISDWTRGLERVGEETRNGVPTVHCRADRETAAALGQAFGGADAATWSMDVWVARDAGYLVSVVQKGEIVSGSSKQTYLVQIDITGINDPANKVEAPE